MHDHPEPVVDQKIVLYNRVDCSVHIWCEDTDRIHLDADAHRESHDGTR